MKLLMLLTFTALAEFDYQRRGTHSCPDLCSCTFSPSVAEVVCSHSSLTHFPITVLSPNITRLSIQSTNLSSITASHLSAVPLLNYLQLYYTNLGNLPSELLGVLPHLDTLDLTGNQLVELPPNFFSHASLCSLVMKSNQFEKAEAAWFPDNSSLTWLDFSGNLLTSIPAALLQKLPHLQNLDLSDNNLQDLQADTFENLHHLETLNLAGNKLISLKPTTFAHNLKLKQLFLQENHLNELPATLLQSLQHLEFLLLNQNRLRHLPTGLLDRTKPSFRMILTKNPWECDVKMEYMWKWFAVNPENVLFLEEVTCVTPETLKHQQVASLTESQLGINSQ
ncbi:phospholipase A2 inhibitor-like [Melanotaenia boesemani]|uniref:phospholipase A2 inhibitor-like n=1 Tax=Melanotaenia boesemani TaxID=1250792 RepID=UPI001C05C185|nr:phospholipase A2 inhibitor-like [Melanotaenia boesemani]